MRSPFIVGLAAGIASAVLVLSVMTGTALAFLLNVLLPLPGLIAGLGWGLKAAVVSVASASLVIALAANPLLQMTYLLAYGLPVLVLTSVALIGREPPRAGEEGEASRLATRPGIMLAAATLLAGLYASAFVLMLGPGREAYAAGVRKLFDQMTTLLPAELRLGIDKLGPAELEKVVGDFVALLPGMTAGVWLVIVVLNLVIARRVLIRSGRIAESGPALFTTEAPFLLLVTFLISVAASFSSGIAGPIANGFSGAHITAFVLIGLAVVHALTLGLAARAFLVILVYAALVIASPVAIALLVILALADTVLRLRERRTTPTSPRSST
jgi:hypothetical protein